MTRKRYSLGVQHPEIKMIITYSAAGVENTIEHSDVRSLVVLQSLKSYIETGVWLDANIPSKHADQSGIILSTADNAEALLSVLKHPILMDIADRCETDRSFADKILAAATIKAKAAGENLASAKAAITRSRNNQTPVKANFLKILKKYGEYQVVAFDYNIPVCSCCRFEHDRSLLVAIDDEVFCAKCASQNAAIAQRHPDFVSDIQKMADYQDDVTSFAAEIAALVTDKTNFDFNELYERVWLNRTRKQLELNLPRMPELEKEYFTQQNNIYSLEEAMYQKLIAPRYSRVLVRCIFETMLITN